ncbi:hypothetical protein [Campylobacter sp. RM12651]|uniref:hypothetical protein n=1 Tax=Campylobacter sp. RM12651 TaxID=1660079 RepID=UPI001EFAA011|nr:hypothetical protein [Campylobacter sp. RM12651]
MILCKKNAGCSDSATSVAFIALILSKFEICSSPTRLKKINASFYFNPILLI